MPRSTKTVGRRQALGWIGAGVATLVGGPVLLEGVANARPDEEAAKAQPGTGRKYYVRAGAPAGGDGQSPDTPFPTLQEAADVTEPGDTVFIMNGEYRDTGEAVNQGPLNITRSGAPGTPIRYTAFPNHHPVIGVTKNGWNGIRVTDAAYITIDGLTLIGNNERLTYEEAFANQDPLVPTFNANGIFVGPPPGDEGVGSHHIIVRNNLVRHWPGGGIATTKTDYVTIERNTAHSNSWYTVYGNGGISILTPYNADQQPGHRNFILRNRTYDNETYIPWQQIGEISDGNGIIVDSTKIEDPANPYLGGTYVANNISFDNGGSGIHAFKSARVDIVNNTVYNNARSPALEWAGLFANTCDDTNLINNIVYGRDGKPTNTNYNNTNVVYDYNIYFNGLEPEVTGSNDLVTDPLLVNPSDSPSEADFHLQSGSPAVDSGTGNLAPEVDYDGERRPTGQGIDRGAYRFPG